MKIFIQLYLIYAFSLTTLGQSKKDYTFYFDQILLIEKATSEENFTESLKLYSRTFNKYERIFARDAFNACQIAALKNHSNFQRFFFECAKSGVPKQLLLSSRHIFQQYRSDSLKLNLVFAKGAGIYLSRIDTSLRNEFKKRFEFEQKNKGKENYKIICSDNFSRILQLAKHDSFPGENLIGADENLESYYTLATLLHYPYSYNLLQPFLWEAVQEGKAQPLSVMYVYSFNQTRTSILYDANIPTDTVNFKIVYNLPFGKRSKDLIQVNKERKLRQIFSLEVEQKLKAVAAKYALDYKYGY